MSILVNVKVKFKAQNVFFFYDNMTEYYVEHGHVFYIKRTFSIFFFSFKVPRVISCIYFLYIFDTLQSKLGSILTLSCYFSEYKRLHRPELIISYTIDNFHDLFFCYRINIHTHTYYIHVSYMWTLQRRVDGIYRGFTSLLKAPDLYDGIVLRLSGRSNNRKLLQKRNATASVQKKKKSSSPFTVYWCRIKIKAIIYFTPPKGIISNASIMCVLFQMVRHIHSILAVFEINLLN